MLPSTRLLIITSFVIVFVVCACICSDSPEPSKRGQDAHPDDPLTENAYPPGQGTQLHGHRLGGNDEAEGEADDGENENEAENNGNNNTGNPHYVNARPAKPGSTSSASAESPEVPIAPPPEPALPPLVIIGEPVQAFAGQLQYRPAPAVGSRLFAYHQRSNPNAPFCCGKKVPGPYSAPLTSRHEKQSSVSQIQLVSVAAPPPLLPKQAPAGAKIVVNEHLTQVLAVPVSGVQPNRQTPGENVVIGKHVLSFASHPKSIPEKPSHQTIVSKNNAISHNQLQLVAISSAPSQFAVPAPAQPSILLERHTATQHLSAPSHVHPASPPAAVTVNDQATAVKQTQIVTVPAPGSPVSVYPETTVNKQVQVVSSAVATPAQSAVKPPPAAPAHVEKVTSVQQLQVAAISAQPPMRPLPAAQAHVEKVTSALHQIQLAAVPNHIQPSPGKLGFSYLSPPSRLFSKHISSVYPVPGPAGHNHLYPVPHATLGLSSAAYGPNFYSPMIGSMVPLPPGLVKQDGHSAVVANQVVDVSQLNHYHSPAAKHPYPAGLGEVVVSISKPPGLVIQPNAPAYPVPPSTPLTPTESYPSPLLPAPPNHVDPYPSFQTYQQSVHTGSNAAAVSHNEVAITQFDSYISPTCAQTAGLAYCYTDPDYPIAEINAYIATYPERYQMLRPLVPWKSNAQHTSVASGSAASHASGEAPAEPTPVDPNAPATTSQSNATEMCVSHINPTAKLYRALNAQDKWKCIVHLPEAYQTSHCDTCDANRTCKYVDSRIQSYCHQDYVLQQMMVYSPEYGLHLDEIKIPRGCQCRLTDTVSHIYQTAHAPPPVPTAGSYVNPTVLAPY